MTEYTRKDIIMDPNDPRLKEAIGKKVYSSSDINLLLHRANNDEHEMTLTQVEDVDSEPFTVTDMDRDEIDADFIIIKKEEPKSKLKYVPFENITEFLDAYRSTPGSLPDEVSYLSNNGIWLMDTETDAYCMVTEIWDSGIVIGDKSVTIGETVVFHDITAWEELLKNYTFLWGTPCGKEVK